MKHHIAVLLLAAAGATAPHRAAAWGDDGHRIVGLIAQQYLDPAVRTRVDALLAGDTTQLVPSPAIADEATWADKYRDSDRNTTHLRYDQTHLWHYVDIELTAPDIDAACNQHPAVPAGTPASAANPKDCVVDKIEQFAAELANPATPAAERLLALQFLLHFVGDLHQPLHAADDHNQGGNAKKVHGTGSSANLHAAWDTFFVNSLGAGDAAIASALLAAISPAQQAQWAQGTAAGWAQESSLLARTQAYGRLPAPGADGAYTLDGGYTGNAQQVVREQLSKAGVRLAWVLNRTLAPAPSPAQQLLGNPGFENGPAGPAPWQLTAAVVTGGSAAPPHAGAWAAWLNGHGRVNTSRVQQTVALPAHLAAATLSFWLHVQTAETSSSKTPDQLSVQVLDASGHVLATVAHFSNLDAAPGWRLVNVDLSAWAGRTVAVRFSGSEDKARATAFAIDDVHLNVK